MATDTTLSITGYNARSLSGNKLYINELLSNSDVLCLSEHRLYENELYKLDDVNNEYESCAKASSDLCSEYQSVKPGHCGIAMLWKKSLSHRIRHVKCESDRICIIEILGACFGRSLFVFGVYLPHQACKITTFEHHLNNNNN